ncbi:hypothetical protein AK812_SmicGene21149 [Symbiodinium microadriaticum]|uniref:G domain-containing protein n=1 Tax=Symbiodinium microadriaticum TaxID=2951 RepID=A0A1Q9DN34_SYMMI|nr:hypothetical protein AK812_SmicGene21149 [Symbiodinium microadriaticum]
MSRRQLWSKRMALVGVWTCLLWMTGYVWPWAWEDLRSLWTAGVKEWLRNPGIISSAKESLTSILAWPIDVWYAAVSECNQLQDEAVAVTAFFAQVNITPMSAVLAFLACLACGVVARCFFRRRSRGQGEVTAYDAVLAFDSLAQFLATGEIKLLQFAASKFEAMQEQRVRIVAVVGLFDKGKTWLTNKLFGKNLPSGKLFTTRGLSFLWVPERRMLVLDSPGVQGTVSYKSRDVDAILDARTTESMMFDMICKISHHVILVVNDNTWLEQEYAAMLLRVFGEGLIVVHNMRMWGVPYGENTKAGRLFNKKNCEYLMQQLELVPKFFLVETAPELDKGVQELKVEYDEYTAVQGKEPEVEGDYVVRGVMKLVSPRQDAQITMKKQGVISRLGEIIAHDVSFEPCANVFDQRVEDGTERLIQIECPGVSEEDIDWEELSNGVKVTIKKEKRIDEAVVQPVQPIMQNHGTWVRNFVFDHSDGRFELRGAEDFSLDQGVLTIKLHKSSQSRRGKVGRHVTQPLPTLLTSTAQSSLAGFEVVSAAEKEAPEGGEEL